MRGYLGLGSNVGDRVANLRAAVDALERRGVAVTARSPVYETEPQGEVLDQPDFLNAAVAIETDLEPEDLLDVCKAVEQELGRTPSLQRHSPRPIDVDLLLLGDLQYESDRLRLPHRDVLARRFVLQPLVDLDAELELPDGTRVADALAALSGQRVERAGSL